MVVFLCEHSKQPSLACYRACELNTTESKHELVNQTYDCNKSLQTNESIKGKKYYVYVETMSCAANSTALAMFNTRVIKLKW